MDKIVVYTTIYGKRDKLLDPLVVPEGVHFVCFTDDKDMKSRIWDVKYIAPHSSEPVRSAKLFKVLPHKYFSEYEHSIFIDGNILVRGDVREAVEKYLHNASFAAYDHLGSHDKRDCIYDELEAILESRRRGRYQHIDPEQLTQQVEGYQKEGYPSHNGLIATMIIFRKHNDPVVIKTMEDWWHEIENKSSRDQLSFNYVAWKNKLKINYIQDDCRNNKYFLQLPHSQKLSLWKRIKRKSKHLFNYLINV